MEHRFQDGAPNASVIMQVPERTPAVGKSGDTPFPRPADLDLTQSTPFQHLALKTPPCGLTPSESLLDLLDSERPPPTPQNEEIRAVGRLKRACSMSENAACQNGQLARTDSTPVLGGGPSAATCDPHHANIRCGISNIDTSLEGTSDMSAVDAASLRRQIIKLNRRLQLLEEENKERAKREMVTYSITIAFWLLNSWLWFRQR
ncbi:mitochondrial fission factor-like [Choloepus didactylus]|uniref:mitochondrial fission factor-like n=1 Tax=Choloepus didactylus TaxID=27675 RepID=UPI0018A0E206|nr:mitochondrial fission factor-like [Choloepus didactylus]